MTVDNGLSFIPPEALKPVLERSPVLPFSTEFKKEVLDQMTPPELWNFAQAHGLRAVVGIEYLGYNRKIFSVSVYLFGENRHNIVYERKLTEDETAKVKDINALREKNDTRTAQEKRVDESSDAMFESTEKELETIKDRLVTNFIALLKKVPKTGFTLLNQIITAENKKSAVSDTVRYWPNIINSAQNDHLTNEEAKHCLEGMRRKRYAGETTADHPEGEIMKVVVGPTPEIDQLADIYYELNQMRASQFRAPSDPATSTENIIRAELFELPIPDRTKARQELRQRQQELTRKFWDTLNEKHRLITELEEKSRIKIDAPQLPSHPFRGDI